MPFLDEPPQPAPPTHTFNRKLGRWIKVKKKTAKPKPNLPLAARSLPEGHPATQPQSPEAGAGLSRSPTRSRESAAGVRTFATGATRSDDTLKPDYQGFLSARAIVRFGEYMNKHRRQPDGTVRAADNWKRGIPPMEYVKSMTRHMVELLVEAEEGRLWNLSTEEILCAIKFNVDGLLHELLRNRKK